MACLITHAYMRPSLSPREGSQLLATTLLIWQVYLFFSELSSVVSETVKNNSNEKKAKMRVACIKWLRSPRWRTASLLNLISSLGYLIPMLANYLLALIVLHRAITNSFRGITLLHATRRAGDCPKEYQKTQSLFTRNRRCHLATDAAS